jgi:F-type H+-transporting ATPase subunit delta
MQNPRLATRYAKSLIDLATEQNILDTVHADMALVQGICKINGEFVSLLRSPIVASDKKESIITAVLQGKTTELTGLFIKLLVAKGREGNLPEIANAYIEQYNVIKNIKTIKLTTAQEVSEEVKSSIVAKIKGSDNYSINLETAVDESLIGGFVVEVGGNIVDASILRDLNDIKKQFLNNDFIQNIR